MSSLTESGRVSDVKGVLNKLYKRKPVAPCKDCEERKPDCHSVCERYKAWSDEWCAQREDINNKISKDSMQLDYTVQGYIKRNKGWKK